jgi:hypothetical protein
MKIDIKAIFGVDLTFYVTVSNKGEVVGRCGA